MRVCFVVWRYPSFSKSDHAGGAEKQLQRLTTELNKRGHETTIISGKKGRNPLLEKPDENISVFRIPTTSLPGISMILYMIILPIIIVRLHFRERFDVIHIPLPDLFIISLYFTSRLLGIPVIARIAADELDQSYSQGLWATVRELIKSVILKVEGIQTLNPMAYNDALLLGKTREQVFLVPNGVNIPDKQKDYTKMSNKVLYIGAMRHYPNKLKLEQKNLKYLIDAFEELVNIRRNLTLVMVGDGNYRKLLEEYVRTKKLTSKVVFTGYQSDVQRFLYDADLVVNPSHFEGMPNVVIESMATGVCVVCSDIPEHRYLIGENEFGQLVDKSDPGSLVDAITKFYQTPSQFIKRAKNARSKVQNQFSISLMTQRILAMYQVVINL